VWQGKVVMAARATQRQLVLVAFSCRASARGGVRPRSSARFYAR